MKVRLVSYSQPTAEFETLGITDAQELIAYCARVSNPANQYNTETSEKLISYLVKHQDRKSTRLNSSHIPLSRMPSSA